MNKPYEYLNAVCRKDNSITEVPEQWINIYLNKVLVQDKNNVDAINKAIEYCFYISPTSYFYLLTMLTPYRHSVFLKSPKKVKEDDEDLLVTKLCYVLGWQKREYLLNKNIVDKLILSDREHWESELGITNKKKRRKK